SNVGKVRHTASPDGGGIHIGFRGAGRNRHRRVDLLFNPLDNATGANPRAPARRPGRKPGTGGWAISPRGGRKPSRGPAKSSRRYIRAYRHIRADEPHSADVY